METMNNVIRPLGFWESACKFGHDFFAGTSNVTVRANISGAFEIARAQTILKILFLRHPLLRAIIIEKSRDFYFSLSAKFIDIPIRTLQCDKESNRHHQHEHFFLNIVEEEQTQLFIINQALWRAVFITCSKTQNHTIIITFHHAIADGLSAVNFIHEFLMFYSDKMAFEKLPFLLSIETMIDSHQSWDDFVKNKIEQNNKTSNQFPFHIFAPISQRKSKNLYKQFELIETNKIKQACRAHHTTITAFLNAVLMKTASQLEETELSLSLHTPVSLRHLAKEKIADYHLGCYISMIKTIHENIHATDDVWKIATHYKTAIQAEIPKTGMPPKDFSLKRFQINEMIDLFDMAGSSKRKYFTVGFGITNIGELNLLEKYGHLKLDDLMFTTNHLMGEYLMFLHVLSLHGTLKICFNFTEPLIQQKWAEKFVKQFETNIDEALK